MLEKIIDPYEYIDYRLLLSDDFLHRSAKNERYSLRAFSRDLNLAPSFVSEVLRGKKEIGLTRSKDIFSRLGHGPDELEYIENLVRFKNSDDEASKQSASDFIRTRYKASPLINKKSKSLLVKSADHFILHGMIGMTSDHKELIAAASSIGIEVSRTTEVLKDFIDAEYVNEENGKYTLTGINMNIPDHEDILSTQKEFVSRLLSLIHKDGGINPPDSISNYLAFGLDRDTLPLAVEAYRNLIKTLSRLSNQTGRGEMYAFYSGTFYTKEVVEGSN